MNKKTIYQILSLIGLGLFFTWWIYPIQIPLTYGFGVSLVFLISLGMMFIFGSLFIRELREKQFSESIKDV